jgi:hypothetical protein
LPGSRCAAAVRQHHRNHRVKHPSAAYINYGINANVSLISWSNIFQDLKRNNYLVIVECEDSDEADFNIGPIKRIARESVNIQNIDPGGRLHRNPTKVKYSDITTVTFGDRYSKTLGKYLKPISEKK